ncbi:MAG: type I-C CRISPR-associated protein Cas8c/Csd1 [Xanthomonadales bacterium]|nr:type I-C CRISPR-associated protein Cas8c/Csd1 [Xanthomonadales bacterium]
MILQALVRYYQRLLDRQTDGISSYGYSPEKISFEILLAHDGSVMQVNDVRDQSGKKPSPRLLDVPQPEKRTAGIKANFLWDKTSYVLGFSATSKRVEQEHEAFKRFHANALAGTTDPGLRALLSFLANWDPDNLRSQDEFTRHGDALIDANVVFRIDGEQQYLHQRPAAREVRAQLLSGNATDASTDAPKASEICLVSGERAEIARLHPAIKGVTGAQSSGAALVSFNLDAFTSYGKSQGENAPVSEHAAFAYTTVLNHLLRRSEHNRQRLQIGDSSVVFWAEADDPAQAELAELTFAGLLEPPVKDDVEAEKVRHILDGLAAGRPLTNIDPQLHPETRMYVLGLAPNASRLSVRFWQSGTLAVLAQRIANHAQDLRIEPVPWHIAPSAFRLVLATVPNRDQSKAKSEDAVNNLVGEILRSVLSGGLYPRSLLHNTVMRIRSDGQISGLRAALCKGVLARERRLGIHTSEEDLPVSLDKQSTQPGYLLGRLFAVLEYAQRSALGGQVNATIRDRYYGAASATPASIFPVLLRNTQNHLGKLRKERPGQAVNLERDLRDIVDGLPDRFPRSLKIEDQGRFAIGYYHQSQAQFTKRDPAAGDTTDTDSDVQEAHA